MTGMKLVGIWLLFIIGTITVSSTSKSSKKFEDYTLEEQIEAIEANIGYAYNNDIIIKEQIKTLDSLSSLQEVSIDTIKTKKKFFKRVFSKEKHDTRIVKDTTTNQ